MVSNLEKFIRVFGDYINWRKLCMQIHLQIAALIKQYEQTSYNDDIELPQMLEECVTRRALAVLATDERVKQLDPTSKHFSEKTPRERYVDALKLMTEGDLEEHFTLKSYVDQVFYIYYKRQLIKNLAHKMEDIIVAEAVAYDGIAPCPNHSVHIPGVEGMGMNCPVCHGAGLVTPPDVVKATKLSPDLGISIDPESIQWAKRWIRDHRQKP